MPPEDEKPGAAPRESRKARTGERTSETGEARLKTAEESAGETEEITPTAEGELEESLPATPKTEDKRSRSHGQRETEKQFPPAASAAGGPEVPRGKSIGKLMGFRRQIRKSRCGG